MSNLSRDYTVDTAWREAIQDLPQEKQFPHNAKLALSNRAQALIAGLFYDLMSEFYMDDATALVSTIGRYSSVAGTWTAATKTLAIVMNGDFLAEMLGNVIMFRVGASIYLAKINSIVSTTSITVDGDNLPSTDQTVDQAMMAATSVTGDVIALDSLRIMMTGQQVRMVIDSTATNNIFPISMESRKSWPASSYGNAKSIVYALSGQNLYLKKGKDLTAYETLTLHYPRVARVLNDGDNLDLPDGVAVQLYILILKTLVATRIGYALPDPTPEIGQKVQMMYQTFGQESNAEEVKKKVEALR